MKKPLLFLVLVAGAAFAAVFLLGGVFAAPLNIQYPVPELGNCRDEAACRAYCDIPGHLQPCLDFAERNNLMSDEEIRMAKSFAAVGEGPGGCTTRDSCEAYCNDISHIDECIDFAEENGILPPDELEEARMVQAAIRRGIQPPPCRGRSECEVYCSNPENMEVCITFAEAAGFMSGRELEESKKVLAAVRRGVRPPPCRGPKDCDVYCGQEEHFEECLAFGEAAGFVSAEEAAMARKTGGKGPGGCKGKEECDRFCEAEENFGTCLAFGEEHGFISREDAEIARKTGGKGPGGCKSKEECETFCGKPENQETCFNFGKEHGLIPEEKLREIEEQKQQFKQTLEQAPAAVVECISSIVGSEMLEKFRRGEIMPPREMGEQMRQCFEKMMGPPPQGPPPEGMPPPGEGMPPMPVGPGGCRNEEECASYCSTHTEECGEFFSRPVPFGSPGAQPPAGGEPFMPPGEFSLPPETPPGEPGVLPLPPEPGMVSPPPVEGISPPPESVPESTPLPAPSEPTSLFERVADFLYGTIGHFLGGLAF